MILGRALRGPPGPSVQRSLLLTLDTFSHPSLLDSMMEPRARSDECPQTKSWTSLSDAMPRHHPDSALWMTGRRRTRRFMLSFLANGGRVSPVCFPQHTFPLLGRSLCLICVPASVSFSNLHLAQLPTKWKNKTRKTASEHVSCWPD